MEPSLFEPEMTTRCVFSMPIGGTAIYRYRLNRIWDKTRLKILFLMLNPSTADELKNDPTVARCIAYARAWGYGGLEVANIFALRSTDPELLYTHADPIGIENDQYIKQALIECDKVVAAWGTHGSFKNRGNDVLKMLKARGKVYCLKKNKDGYPVHPLYQRADAQLIEL